MAARVDWREIEPWEPEESIGKLWHGWASGFDSVPVHEDARVHLSEVSGRLAVLFRGLGGDHSIEMRPAGDRVSRHRLSWLRRLGTAAEALPLPEFDGGILRLPATLALLPTPEANGALYLWLAAHAAHLVAPVDTGGDPLRRDLARLAAAQATVDRVAEAAPGLMGLYGELRGLILAGRPRGNLPPEEAAVEELTRHLLGDDAPLSPRAAEMLAALDGDLSGFTAPRRYQPMRPVPLWVVSEAGAASSPDRVETREAEGEALETGEHQERTIRARRRQAEAADRKDSLIINRFEAILSWAEFLNLNRRVDDDDDDSARKALDDQEELGLGQISKAPATRLKLHLDLAPEDVDREALSGVFTYPEWDAKAGRYLPAHARVLDSEGKPGEAGAASFDDAARRRIRAVRRQFEAMRPGRVVTTGHRDGEELDLDLTVRSRVGITVSGEGSDRIWKQSRPQNRDLAVSILLDISRSTESAVTGRAVIDIEREALAALAWGLDATGDQVGVQAFCSLKRGRVFVTTCKRFDEPMSALVESRIAALRPAFYTRLGAGIRHATATLAGQGRRRRLLLVITDGKPNDLDHYEGRHGIEDSAMAVREARRAGHSVFGITVDRDGKSWFPRIFGQGGHALIPHPDKLPEALPHIYRQLVGA
ncbi:nitric oxide reductase activation protein NorD [Paracoccus sp. (in: a-proteobacteria)]|uniref:nitric oxide reductase activation protein NorD n=1 Tax=Paracoccus sp. TaxID=267 RepID=UPI0026DEBE7D|nr:VWA domain-containing protein [Paracoccus sp. (in: a-proteobacteria)]MDO5370666.1 nitric oxide reductase D protein [Paracoccus sp. (in: a-proteobacteria)]